MNEVNGTYRRWEATYNGSLGILLVTKYAKSTLLRLDGINGGRESTAYFVICRYASESRWCLGRLVKQNECFVFQLLYETDHNQQLQYPPEAGWRPTDNGHGTLPSPRMIQVIDFVQVAEQEALIVAAEARARLREDVRRSLSRSARVRNLQFSTYLEQIGTDNVDSTCVVCFRVIRGETNIAIIECNCRGVGGRFMHSRCLETCFMEGVTSCPLCRLSLEE